MIVGRIVRSLPTFFGASLIAFFLIRLVPGDPVMLMLGERGASPEVMRQMRADLGLDRPMAEQYLLFLGQALRGRLGDSIVSKRPVLEEFRDRFPATVELGLAAMILAVVIGVPMGILAAVWRGRLLDRLLVGMSLFGYSMPIFWWGLLLILVFSVHLGWFPVSGRMSPSYDVDPWSGFLLIDTWARGPGLAAFQDAVSHLALPAVVLSTIPLGAVSRMTRSSLLEVLREDYVRTARSKGLAPFRVIFVHALKNAMIPIVTVIGLMLGSILTGAVLTETIFSWPGIGRWLINGVQARDYPILQGGILLVSFFVILTNVCVDCLYIYLNPRLREPA